MAHINFAKKSNMKILKEFKEFAVKGNMIEMAVGIVIGASFNSVIDVLVKNVLLPPLSLLSDGAVSYTHLTLPTILLV